MAQRGPFGNWLGRIMGDWLGPAQSEPDVPPPPLPAADRFRYRLAPGGRYSADPRIGIAAARRLLLRRK